ncbi:AraC family transcriptional regulator [Pseudoalteromonas sp. NBT06-2]|uniref:AraC family transcriptional regulator n=1 Tax=Pseudoalteromonas sp. NBT06-2 TaxID=2025950 RepID=UPI000BA6133E|nr:helix-turn-helix transcriptional regulator [Pseudoalteromonas sp. NBT06-2]PAJ75313.1 AraC family transcriptional regulator [Pseudoalteromonas sp. NBT06-2]
MPINLSKQTSLKWTKQSPSRLYPELPRPIVSIAHEFKAMTHIVSHSHPWSQLCYSCKGVTQTETKEGIFVLPPEQALWLPAKAEHQQRLKNSGSNRSLYIDPDWSEPLGNKVRSLTVDPLLKALILEIANWPEQYQQTEQTDRLVRVLIDRLAIAPSNELFMPTIKDNRLLPIIEVLNNEPANKLTIEQWATKVGASSRTLNRLFNKSYGMGFSKWKQKIRILKSLELLNEAVPLQEIAYSLGYESSSAFLTCFKKQLGCSPKKYILK